MSFSYSKFRRALACAAFLAAAGGGSALTAQAASCELPKMKAAERPQAGGAPTKTGSSSSDW